MSSSEPSSHLANYWKIIYVFLIGKSVQYLLVISTPPFPFDTSTSLLLDTLVTDKSEISNLANRLVWNKLLSWDAVYFIKGMIDSPEFENEFAFSLLWKKLVKMSTNGDNFYRILYTAVFYENIFHLLSCLVLYHLTLETFGSKRKFSREMALKTSILFVFTSAAGFLLSIYSESLSCLLAFTGVWLRELSVKFVSSKQFDIPWKYWPLYVIATTLCFTLATVNRTNCILLGLFYIFDLFQLIKLRHYKKAFLIPFLAGFLMFSCIIYQQYYIPFRTFCPQRGEWCHTQIYGFITKESLYSFIQSRYWNVGFLRYWTISNVPNFIMGFPNLIILVYSIIYFTRVYPINNLKPLCLISGGFLIIMIFLAHFQIINRLITFIPLHLWYLADRLVKKGQIKEGKMMRGGDDTIVKSYIYWLMIWIPVQTVLFACFLPPA
ncbi:hypothetical protein KAFR_0C00740 [Kazachstania africana CBS 2517]|uniref:GPI mannosyltransferase 2 n=1 Tax=Kazachstania africana (strain ATCC 22294 / BCRC 22015 / CBS 2517 / CECT 1963 / NBRC 1671 / NRRL Y-8276) TaxID=1071382 RepID=H2ARR9_KAZAF|nr:hypothetical protein KAFR_0C00740 [Kazachstania africana CBS 2517]CCF57069.1 hypothetical protein KAFR_0C00740 [Kazachstania africana CBS 2517]